MELLTLNQFIPHLTPFSNKDLLTPGEASRLSLIITELLIDRNVDFELLKFLSRFLTKESYDDIVEERNIEHSCGYIMCNNTPTQPVTRRLSNNSNGTTTTNTVETKFQIYNRKPSIILPNTFSSQYCCKGHYQASLFYKNQLSGEATFARKDIMVAAPFPQNYPANWYENGITCLEEVLEKQTQAENQGKSLSEIVWMMSGLTVDDDDSRSTTELIKLIEDFEIVEKETGNEPPVQSFGEGEPEEEDDDDNAIIDDDVPFRKTLNLPYASKLTNSNFGGYVIN